MPEHPNGQHIEAERAELERVVEALARWPRLSHLLRYMGEKRFSGEADRLNEYNIATEVLGRSKTAFNAGEDAIARVETHRLRRRLTEFYEGEGRGHLIKVALPAGTYVPIFIHRPAEQLFGSDSGKSGRRWSFTISRRWKQLVFAVTLVLVALGAYRYLRNGASSTRVKSDSSPSSVSVPFQSEPTSLPTSTIRLLAGYGGPPRTDSAARVWNPDQYFSGGGGWRRTPGVIERTSDAFLFDDSRTGDFSYIIPLKPGSYELHLFFSTPIRATEGIATFNVSINGEPVLRGFDINADALGENVADERVFRDVSPGKDGFLRVGFS